MTGHIGRREFVTLLGSAAAAWPFAAHSQHSERMRRIGVLMGLVANDPEAQSRVAAFENGLRELGWVKGRNLSIEYRWAGDADGLRGHVADCDPSCLTRRETRLRGWACETRTQKRREKLSL
jgi:putative tryptophan/tyrosine transport system substrate-binding protein